LFEIRTANLSLARSRNGQTTGLALRTSTLKEDVAVQSSEWEDNFTILYGEAVS
jgi:hypothetical protein